MTDIDATQVYKAFSHDVTAAILVSQNNETAAMLVSQNSIVKVEGFFLCKNCFVPIKLCSCWPRQ